MKKGFIWVCEGADGAGKTTIVKKLEEYLDNKGIEYISTREPGGIPISEQIREVILDKKNVSMDGRTEALLYAAARRQHLVEKIIPALNDGKLVICDRFLDSSLAYQGYARGLGIDEVLKINEFALEGHIPDVTFYLDIDSEVALERIKNNKEREVNRLDLEKLEFHKKVREGYHILLDRYSERMRVINANQTIENVFKDFIEAVDCELKKIGYV